MPSINQLITELLLYYIIIIELIIKLQKYCITESRKTRLTKKQPKEI